MKTVKRSIILCLCAALLLIPLMTSCDLLEDAQGLLGDITQKDCGHEPYHILYMSSHGLINVYFDPCYTKPFVLELPETDEAGNPITAIRTTSSTALVPTIIAAEDFEVFRGKLEEYYGLTYEEAMIYKNDPKHPMYNAAFYFFKNMSYFRYMSLDDCPTDRMKMDMLAAYPITEKMDIYVLDSSATVEEVLRIYALARKAAPDLDDVWYRDACERTEYYYQSGLCETMTEIRWPSRLSQILNLAFVGCDGLQTVTVPGSVRLVGEGAFACCDALETVTFEEGTIEIGACALFDCPQLKTVNLPASLESLDFLFAWELVNDGNEQELPTINYGGTMAQWEELFRGVNEMLDPDEVDYLGYEYFDIHCSDGVMEAVRTRR